MKSYLDTLAHILKDGEDRPSRTGVDTRGVFGVQTRYNLQDGFPAITTKKLAWPAIVSELLWFLEGSNRERRLCEIRHRTTDSEMKTIWTANAEADYWKRKAKFTGDLGRIYGVQWRHWETFHSFANSEDGLKIGRLDETDQIANLIDGIKNDPYGRRHMVVSYNPGELDQMALPPCHVMFQMYVSSNNELSCQMYQRSADWFLGIPYNIASYSLLTHMIAQVCGLKVGEFIHTVGDAHLYNNHFDQAQEQLSREPLPLPKLWLNPDIMCIDDFRMDDIKLENYQSHPAIKAEMAV